MSHPEPAVLKTSIVVVSLGRPAHLRRCVLSLSQLEHPSFEIVVVADDSGLKAVRSLPFASYLKLVKNTFANISLARNAGIAEAAGDIVAFIDDDAVAEPTWLSNLTLPICENLAEAATGYTLGRNGISLQWGATSIDLLGRDRQVSSVSKPYTVYDPGGEGAVKLQGVNMAFKTSTLVELGGFDPGYRFYLEDGDISMRMAVSGRRVAVVPDAVVHHAFASSERRTRNRVPRDLHDIGASEAVFQRRFGTRASTAVAQDRGRHAQRRRLLKLMVSGAIAPGDVGTLLRGYDLGWQDGLGRNLPDVQKLSITGADYQKMPKIWGAMRFISGRRSNLKHLIDEARQRTQKGERVSLLVLSRTSLWHRVTYENDGFWCQRGGLWGKAERSEPIFQRYRFHNRAQVECKRVKVLRGLS